MARILLKIAYDGTDCCGFQLQPDKRTVEGELNRAVKAITGEDIKVIGASRTDAGVHALGNVCVFDTVAKIPPEKYSLALNTKLPPDIRVTESFETAADFHPRHCDTVKTYIYRIDNRPYAHPFTKRFAMHFPRKLDTERMRAAGRILLGEHDFTSFANPSSQVLLSGGSAVRTVFSIDIDGESGGEITITVKGNGFLYNMVRIIAGTLIEAGTGRFAPEDIEKMLSAMDRTKAGPTAEAKGLTLKCIEFM